MFSSITAQESTQKSPNQTSAAEVLGAYQALLEGSAEGSRVASRNSENEDLRVKLAKFDLAIRLVQNPTWSDFQKQQTLQEILALETASAKIPFSINGTQNLDSSLLLIKKYVDVASLSSETERKKAFLDSTVEDKKSIWKARLAVHLSMEPMTRSQQALVLELLTILDDAAVFSGSTSSELRAKYDDFERRAREQFGKADTYRLFMSLGNNTGCSALPEVTVSPRQAAPCTCYYDSYCEIRNEHHQCRGGCTKAPGCGIFGGTDCEGRCR